MARKLKCIALVSAISLLLYLGLWILGSGLSEGAHWILIGSLIFFCLVPEFTALEISRRQRKMFRRRFANCI